MQRCLATMGAVAILAILTFYVGCDEKTKTRTVTNTVTVTVNHYFYEAFMSDNNGGVGGFCVYDVDNSFAAEHYGTVTAGSLEAAPFMGNEMDVGYMVFDLGALGASANAALDSLTLYMYLTDTLSNEVSFYITQTVPSSGNALDMFDSIYAGAAVAQFDALDNGVYNVSIDPANVTLVDGKLYLGLYSSAGWTDHIMATFNESLAYIRAEYVETP